MATTRTGTRAQDDILALEERYWQAVKAGDAEEVMALTDASCLVAGPQGFRELSARQVASMVPSPMHQVLSFHIDDDAEVRLLGEDVAVIAYRVHEELRVDGADVKLDAAETSTWVRRDGEWKCALHTESVLGDPFGRDRQRA